ncbi:hypothetical protein ACMFMG_000327 [Clarireedia jacksonii]
MDLEGAIEQHELLKMVPAIHFDPNTFEFQNNPQVLLANILQKAIHMDPEAAPAMIQTLRNYLETFDDRDDDFDIMTEYMSHRIANCGYCWGVGTVMPEEDYESIREYDVTMGNILGFKNDYFSWHVEKDQPTDQIRNGVRVLMKQHNLPAEVARKLLLGMIVEEENKALKLREERLRSYASNPVL